MTDQKGVDWSKDNVYDGIGRADLKPKQEIFFPAQCKCGHLFLEHYKLLTPKNGIVGFSWCGFCRTRQDKEEQS